MRAHQTAKPNQRHSQQTIWFKHAVIWLKKAPRVRPSQPSQPQNCRLCPCHGFQVQLRGSEGSALGRLGLFFDCYDQTVGTKPQEEYWLPRASKLWTWNAAVSCVSSSMPHSSRNQPDESGECHSLLSRTRNREGAPREMQAAASSLQHEVRLLRHPVDVVVIICACGFFNFFFYLDRWSKSCRKLSILWSYLDITLLSSCF